MRAGWAVLRWGNPPPGERGSGGQGAGGRAGDDLDGVGGVGEGDDLGVFPLVCSSQGKGSSGRRMITPQPVLARRVMSPLPAGDLLGSVVGVGDDGQQPGGPGAGQAERAVEGVDRPAELLGAVRCLEVGDLGGCLEGWVRAWTCSPYKTVAVVAPGSAEAARARIQPADKAVRCLTDSVMGLSGDFAGLAGLPAVDDEGDG